MLAWNYGNRYIIKSLNRLDACWSSPQSPIRESIQDVAGPRYDTVRDTCYPTTETVVLSYIYANILEPSSLAGLADEPDPEKLAQVKDAMETFVKGRKYEVLLLRSQGKSMGEIALILSLSKSTVQTYYRQAVRQVREAMGLISRETNGRVRPPEAPPAK